MVTLSYTDGRPKSYILAYLGWFGENIVIGGSGRSAFIPLASIANDPEGRAEKRERERERERESESESERERKAA